MPRHDEEADRELTPEERDFEPEERAALRAMMRSSSRVEWFWTTAGIWLKWLFVIAAGIASIKLAIGDILKGWFAR